MLAFEILTGNLKKLPNYVEFLLNNPKEVLPGIISILEAALAYNVIVDHEIDLLLIHVNDFDTYENRVDSAYYLALYHLLALYRAKNKRFYEAIDYALHILAASDKLNDDKCFKKTIAFFDALRNHASPPQLETYQAIQKTILKGAIENEEGIDLSFVNDWNSK